MMWLLFTVKLGICLTSSALLYLLGTSDTALLYPDFWESENLLTIYAP